MDDQPKINLKENQQFVELPSFWQSLIHGDVLWALQFLLRDGSHYIDPVTKKITPRTSGIDWAGGRGWGNPWINVHQSPKRNCALYMNVIYECVKQGGGEPFVPKACYNCWKVVIRPHNIVDLFRLYDLMRERVAKKRWDCKCGVEERNYVFGNYGGYLYANSQTEGEFKWKKMRKWVDETLGPETPVILKRACTEYERDLGPTDEPRWLERPPNADVIERWITDAVDYSVFEHTGQPEYLKNHIMRYWLERAWNVGDPHVKKFNHNKPLHPDLVTYHQGLERIPMGDQNDE